MYLINAYDHAVKSKIIDDDIQQRHLIAHFERLYKAVVDSSKDIFVWRKKTIPGIYLYGSIGVGKTFLMDFFYTRLPINRKMRWHFHAFMQYIDTQLRQSQGVKNPVEKIGNRLAKKCRVLCIDEFLVNDVAYAMILNELLPVLVGKGVILLMTSNLAPDELYKEGVQRDRFLKTISLIKTHCEVLKFEAQDRRSKLLRLKQRYFIQNAQVTTQLESLFRSMSAQVEEHGTITVQKRNIAYVFKSETAIWFEFDVLCNLPRSQLDYLEIADRFNLIFLSNVPILRENDTSKVILFMHFIDVIYDHKIRLVISAATSLSQLYLQGEMLAPFQRTLSRLKELQSY